MWVQRDSPAMSRFDEGKEAGSEQPAHIVVVDEDPAAQHVVVNYLEQHNMRVAGISRGRDVMSQFSVAEPSLVILDLRLGEDDGLDVLREIRSHSDVPVIITSDQRDEIDRVIGFELGADDYMAKPFGLRELLARVRAILRRRVGSRISPQRNLERGRCRFGGWQFERDNRRLTDPKGAIVALTKGEYALLTAFLDAPQRPLSREYLLQATRMHKDVFDRTIDVQVLRLRHKLETDPDLPRMIQTERGVGYSFALSVRGFGDIARDEWPNRTF